MKKFVLSALLVTGFVTAAAFAPDIEIKIVEKSAAACDSPGCGND